MPVSRRDSKSCETGTAVVVGGDMPWLAPAVLRRLAMSIGPRASAATLEVAGSIQPLPLAIDVQAARRSASSILARGGRSLRDLLLELGAIAVPAAAWRNLDPTGATLADVDRPADLER